MPDQPQTPSGWLPPKAPEGRPPPRFEVPAYSPPRPPSVPPVTAEEERPTFVTEAVRGPRTASGGRANPFAIASLLSGIAGLLLLAFSLGLGFFLALPCSIAAWLLAIQAKKRIADGGLTSGAGQTGAALVIAKLGVALGVIAMVVWVSLLASGFSLEDFQQDLERELERQRDSRAQAAVSLRTSEGVA